MKITIDKHDGGFTMKIDRPPLPEERFKAVCAVLLAVLYTAAVIVTVAMSGIEGFFILLPVTAAFCGAMCWVLGVSLI